MPQTKTAKAVRCCLSPHNFGFIPEGIRISFIVDEADVQLGW